MNLGDLMKKLDEGLQNALVPDNLKQKGWTYWDMPSGVRLTLESWRAMLAAMGEGHQLLISSTYGEGDATKMRGQFIVSPEARRIGEMWVSQGSKQ